MTTAKRFKKLSAFIGSNNETGEVDIETIKDGLKQFGFAGYTMIKATGYWQRVAENSINLIVYEYTDLNMNVTIDLNFKSLMEYLCKELDQFEIWYTITEETVLIAKK